MTKLKVLHIFANSSGFLTPDDVLRQLRPMPDRRSLYSYLGRLRGQGLLDRHPNSKRGQLAYRLTEKRKRQDGILAPKLVSRSFPVVNIARPDSKTPATPKALTLRMYVTWKPFGAATHARPVN